jgi:TolB protein
MEAMEIVGEAELFVPGVVSSSFSDVRLTISADGQTALWFSRDRPGGPGEYDIWMSKRTATGWSAPTSVSFNSPQRDFDPAFSSDDRYVYFSSDRPGGIGGDDIYRVAATTDGFGPPEHLGSEVNSSGNEWAPMLSPDNTLLLFSSNGRGGAGRFDLFTARRVESGRFEPAVPLRGHVNTAADEFDATFLSDGTTIVFSRAADLKIDRVDLFYTVLEGESYDVGLPLPQSVNTYDKGTYGPMLDWARPDHITFSGQRQEAHLGSTDLYSVRYRLRRER